MGNKNIFLDDESEQILNREKEQNEKFNFSYFIQECLKKKGGNNLDESAILAQIKDAEQRRKKADDDLEIWTKKYDEFRIQKAINDKQKAEKELIEKQELEHKKHLEEIDNYLKLNPDYVDEYRQGIRDKKWKTLQQYVEVKLLENGEKQ